MVEDFSQKLNAMLAGIYKNHPDTGLVTVEGEVADTRLSVVEGKVVLHVSASPQEFPTAMQVYHLRP